MTIYIETSFYHGGYIIGDDCGNRVKYIYYTKRDALRKFKAQYGYTGKRGIEIIDMT
jgi:hypothetical protein